jgi:hypothetical protein
MSALTIDSHTVTDGLDEIGRRIEHMIQEQDSMVSVPSTPHWELAYDARRERVTTMMHLHGDVKQVAIVFLDANGASEARCTNCGAALQISAKAA